MKEEKIVLGIETSCDETAIALVSSSGKKILSNHLHSQVKEHMAYGGVVPEIAARSHIEWIDILMKKVKIDHEELLSNIDAVAVTAGPGLIGGVIVGVMFAKGLALSMNTKCLPINHLEGHALMPRLEQNISFPYLLLLASGGHCQIVLVKGVGMYRIIGETLDDSAGEAFDKVGKMLKLPYPGGPQIEEKARLGDETSYIFPKPLLRENNSDMSFSGLKTAVRRSIEKSENMTDEIRNNICASFQKTVSDIFVNKLTYALKLCDAEQVRPSSLVFSGGVAANKYIRNKLTDLAHDFGMDFFAPSTRLCTDNAAMIAWAGIERILAEKADYSLFFKPKSRWSLDSL